MYKKRRDTHIYTRTKGREGKEIMFDLFPSLDVTWQGTVKVELDYNFMT